MEITKDALLRLVKATRMAHQLAGDTKALLRNKNEWTVADDISGFLCDVLSEIAGEELKPEQDFDKDSQTMWLLRSYKSDKQVADSFLKMYKDKHPEQPKPNLISRDELDKMLGRYGVRRQTMNAEGEWIP